MQRIRTSSLGLGIAAAIIACSFSTSVHAQRVPAATPVPSPTASPDRSVVAPTSRLLSTASAQRPPEAVMSDFKLPLRKLLAPEEPLILRSATSIYTMFVPLSARMRLKTCSLHLEYTNSLALIPERSILRIVMNDVIVAQYRLDPATPFNAVDVPIPVALMKTGFNRLQFIVTQHYTYKCEDPDSPELYTEIRPDTSYLSATGDLRPIPSRLSFLRWWIDEKLWFPYDFNICIPGSSQPSDLHLAWGSIITQGVGLAMNYQPFRVYTADALRPGMDNIVIGTMSELSKFLTATEIGAINGSFIAIKPLPGDASHCMIILSGRTDDEVGQTALAFALVNFPLPDSQYALLDQLVLPETAAYVRNAPLETPGIYGFRQLGFKSSTVRGFNKGGFSLQVYMPGDISKEDRSNMELRLHFTYGAALRKDSVFNVFINKQFQTAIRLADTDGAMHSDHRLYLPMLALQPGRNVLDLTPIMVPLYSDFCELRQEENLQLTLYDDSAFVLPAALRKARLPSLGIFSQTAFPYSAPPDGVETAVFAASRDPETMCATWTLLGKMAQISGALMHRAEMSFKLPRSKKSLIVVGPRDQIPDEVLAKAPVSPLQVGKMRYLVSISPKPEKLAASAVEEFLQKMRGDSGESNEPQPPSTVNVNMQSDMVDDTVAVQFESPINIGYPVTLITANDSARLLSGVNALQDRRWWDNLVGDLAVWTKEVDSLAVAKVGPDFIYKSSSVVDRVATRVDRYPWLFATSVVVILIILGFVAHIALRSRERRQDNP